MSSISPQQSHWKPRHSPWLIAISVLLATFMEILDTSIANVALPHIAGSLSASVSEATWVLTSYLVANAVILSATGWLSSRFGRKNYLAFSVILFVVSSAFCGMAHSLGQIIVARILQGLGGGGLQPLSQAILLESFPIENRGPAMAAYGMGVVVAPILGPILGGWITDSYSWRWIFYINIPIGIAGLIMQNMFVEDPPYIKAAKAPKIDYIGFSLMALGIGLLQIVLDKGQEADWFSSRWICWSAVIAVIAVILFIWHELRDPHPIVNLRVLKNRNFAVATFLVAILGAVLYGNTATLPIMLQGLMGYTALASGWVMTPRGVGSLLSMFIVGQVVKKIDGRLLIAGGFLGIAWTSLMLSHLNFNIDPSSIQIPLIFNGFATGFIFVPLTVVGYATLRQDQIFQATGIYNLMRNIGGSIGISVLIAMQDRSAQTHQVVLAGHLSQMSPNFRNFTAVIERSIGGFPLNSFHAAQGMVYHLLIQQATFLSFMDVFRWMAEASFICIFAVALFKKSAPPVHVEMMD
jgi:DHA2 family multidrug resistance protein